MTRGLCPFELSSDETVTLSGGGNLLFGIRCDEAPEAMHVVTRKTFRLPNVNLPRASDIHSSGNVLPISGMSIVYTKFNHIVCIRGR